MTLKETISSYIRYNHWANERLTQWLQTSSNEVLYTETNASFASIDLTLQHMKNAQFFWYEVITEGDVKKLDETIKVKSIEAVIEELLRGSEKMVDTYTTFSEKQLAADINSPVMTRTRHDFIMHVINHNSYHRGQIITIARILGAVSNIPETDYETYFWDQETKAKE
ncbi:DinB family protein [uncultured Imperialibacter sp.]|uniref:DinB family protein n=1 Tax=uncultured Imperialibacter sp. TaxID=1672639 RepID=UPI0030DD11F1|tara:strand:+ start:5056 stop:5559 length:504 start_codon:yes stop_codon:yes gene_type:complete